MSAPKVLVVEDDESLALLIDTVLRKNGYEARIVTDGIQAMSVSREFRPDLVILDFMFPGGGGPAFHNRLRMLVQTKHTPILILSAVDESEVIKKIAFDPNTYFLGKPYQKQELLDILSQMLEPDGAADAA